MLIIFRTLIVIIYSLLICVFGCIWCLFSPRNPRHVATFSRLFGALSPLFGIKVEVRRPKCVNHHGNVIYIANHQNNYDMITAANIVQPATVTVGKKSLKWIPFFGQLYWLAGNLLIDRDNHAEAYNAITKVINEFKRKRISFWIFPEGTRSRGRGLLPFKTGAFHMAILAGVPIIPIVVSNIHDKIKLNRWKNGLVIVEMLPPIDVSAFEKGSVRKLANYCHTLMQAKLNELDAEVSNRESNGEL